MLKWELSPDVPAHLLQIYSEQVRKMLYARGLVVEADAERFLVPKYEDLLDPFLFKDMEKAVVRIFEAIEAGQKIVIYSDYDCDGIPAATIMSDLFKRIGYANVRFYIPHRHDEGYGLHMDAVKEFVKDGVKLIVTFDLGITAINEVVYAQANDVDVIVTDHHLPHGEAPHAFAIVNPHLEDAGYPEKVLCGSGVAFKVAQAFAKKYGEYFKIQEGWEKWLLDVAALGTLSDMVPLTGENRILTYFGMKVLRKNKRPGFRALFSKLKMDTEHLTEDDLTFMVAPRINAASRMSDPIRAFELLSAENDVSANAGADYLSTINDERKLLVARIMKEVKSTLSKRTEESTVLVIGSTGWPAGVLGLVAGKLCEELLRPVFVWGMEEEDELIKGSCRSDGSVNLVDLMTAVRDQFVTFGGHTSAGGFVATREKIHFLEMALVEQYAVLKISGETAIPKRALATLALDSVTPRFIAELDRFAPFGLQNPKPIFLFQNITLISVRQFGKTKEHLEVVMSDGRGQSKAIAFFKSIHDFSSAEKTGEKNENGSEKVFSAGSEVTVVGTLEMSYFRGREARVRIIDIF